VRRGRAFALAFALALLGLPTIADAAEFAPVDRPGPALSVPQAQLDASFKCSGGVAGAARAPILLVPATGVNPDTNYSWNYERAFNALGIPWCTVELPDNSLADIQVAGEYVAHAIRKLHALSGRQIAIMGHSQGGMVPRWALRFWPDTRPMVDDVIGFAASNHGSAVDPDPTCIGGCSPAFLQQHAGSQFLTALNSAQETFPGISYTEVYTHFDEVVTPNQDDNGSSSLHGGGGLITNVATQDICPTDIYEHLSIGTVDPVAYALAIDALSHAGPANETAVGAMAPALCLQPWQPGVNPLTAVTDQAVSTATLLANIGAYPRSQSEPPLRCYVFLAGCGTQATPARPSPYGKSKCKKRKRGKHAKRKRCHKNHKKHRKRR
jgi:hypothetical protein